MTSEQVLAGWKLAETRRVGSSSETGPTQPGMQKGGFS